MIMPNDSKCKYFMLSAKYPSMTEVALNDDIQLVQSVQIICHLHVAATFINALALHSVPLILIAD